GVLEDDLRLAGIAHELRRGEAGHVLAIEADDAGSRDFLQQDQLGGRRLAAAGFADDAERLAWLDREVDAVHRLDPGDAPPRGDAADARAMFGQALSLQPPRHGAS